MKKIYNFSPGPCILPQEVFEKAAKSVLNFNDLGLSILEISHRSKDFLVVMEEATSLVKELLDVPSGYSVLFLQGGASLGFYLCGLNFIKENNGKAAYLDTGVWSSKAIKEVTRLGNIEVVASSKDSGYSIVPKAFNIPEDADFFHYTSNNTIYGTKVDLPKTTVPVIADMSSDIFSKQINISSYAMIYAGAQKNMGPAGVTMYIVKDELLGHTGRDIPSMLNLSLQSDKGSMFNTPPVFSIYASMLTLKWLKKKGGVSAIAKENTAKAKLLYQELDNNPNFKANISSEQDRSFMNVTFDLIDTSLADNFNSFLNQHYISGLKGHRLAGGYRASLYNALPLSSVEYLVDKLQSFNK